MVEAYRGILERFIRLYNQLENVADKKLFISQFVEQTEKIKWKGLSRIVEKIGEDILSKEQSGLVYATIARILIRDMPNKAFELIKELDSNAEVLFEWSFDAALAYGLIAEAFLDIDDREKSLFYLNKGIEYALKIPDRSDRSIALARLMPLIFTFYGLQESLEYLKKITYEIKRVDAIVRIIHTSTKLDIKVDLKSLLPFVPREKQTYIISEWTKGISKYSIEMALDVANGFLRHAMSNLNNIDNLRALTNFLEIYLLSNDGSFDSNAKKLIQTIKQSILTNIYKREFLAVLFDLIETLLKFEKKEETNNLLSEIKMHLSHDDPSIEIFVFNKLARVYAKYKYFDDVNLYLESGYQTLETVDVVVRTPLLVDTLSATLYAINEFPDFVPENLAKEYAEKIRPAEIAEVKIRIFRDNLAYLKERYGDKIDDAINEIIQMDRLLNLKELELRARDILMGLLDKRDGSFILNYILKYSYEANLPEAARLEVLELLGAATSALLKNDPQKAREYVELALREFERRKVPLLPIILRFFQEYLLMTLP